MQKHLQLQLGNKCFNRFGKSKLIVHKQWEYTFGRSFSASKPQKEINQSAFPLLIFPVGSSEEHVPCKER